MIPVEIGDTDLPEGAVRRTYAKDQPEYLPLPVVTLNKDSGTMVSCWQLTPEELEDVIKTGRVYLAQMTFHQPLQPVMLATSLAEALR